MTITRRSLLAGALLTGVGAALAGCAPGTPAPTRSPVLLPPLWQGRLPFASGASCIGAANGEFGGWRSFRTRVHGSWATDGRTDVFDSGEEYGSWDGDMDFAPQYYLEDDDGFRWSRCARGDYDDRFREDLATLRDVWGERPGRLYYRFQHEFNGTWYPWSVDDDTADAFVRGWRRFATIFREVLGDDDRFRLVWSPNAGVDSSDVSDIRTVYPGDDHVDVIGIDFYDFFTLRDDDDWDRQAVNTDSGGGPVGLNEWRDFAREHGKPLALAEWGQQYGDNPLFIEKVHEFLTENAYSGDGSDSGTVIYEIYFNQLLDDGSVDSEGDFRLQIDGVDHPGRVEAAEAYRRLWRSFA